jgi:hypothetical protein
VPEHVEVQNKELDLSTPEWAADCKVNLRHLTSWSNDQYVGLVEIGGALVEAIMDSGGARTMVDGRTARAAGWAWSEARGGEFGTYITPGGETRQYMGVIPGPVEIRFS